ncbi:MAG: tetratricopeptide repeat protein, partial [Candidatus Heimdallarchaeaceae archaeon]
IHFDVIDYLDSIDFSSKLYENWRSWKKNEDEPIYDAFSFYNHWTSKIKKCLLSDAKIDTMFNFIESLDKNEFDYFCFEQVDILSLRKTNLGLKYFSNGNLEKAKELFLEALKLQPSDPASNWNLARLLKVSKDKERVLSYYKLAMSNIITRKHKEKIRQEIKYLKNGKGKAILLESIEIRF